MGVCGLSEFGVKIVGGYNEDKGEGFGRFLFYVFFGKI